MEITLNEALKIMEQINKSKDFECYFSNGKPIIQSKIIEIKGGYKP